MTDIPRAVITARRTAGAILVVSALATITALVLVFAWWFTLPPTVGVVSPPGSVPSYTAQIPSPVPAAPTDPGAVLAQQAANDRSTVATIPEGYWVPQLSSKHIGTVDDGITYTEQDIVDNHQRLRSAYPGAVLLWSGDYTTFSASDYWVTIMPAIYSSSHESANEWCVSQQIDWRHCFAKRISATSYYDQTTKNR